MRASPRVLFVDQSGQLGGAELMLADVAARFGAAGTVLLFQDGPFREHLAARGIPVRVIGGGPLAVTKAGGLGSWLRVLPAFTRLVRETWQTAEGPDVLYANTAKALIVGAVVAAGRRKPLVFHLHDLVSPDHFSRLNRWLLVRVASTFARTIIANSEATRDAFIAAGGRAERHVVIYNGFDPGRFSPGAIAPRIRGEFPVGAKPLAVVIGRLTPWKGQHVLLAAARALPELHVLVVGGALFTPEDRAYEAQLRREAAEPELRGRVHFAGHRDDIVPFYHAADVVVHCSVAPEPFGRVVVEAMLAGRPVLAADAGGVREILQEPGTGELVPPNDASALAEALRRLLADPDRARRMAAAGQAMARRRFGLDGVLDATEAAVDSARHRSSDSSTTNPT